MQFVKSAEVVSSGNCDIVTRRLKGKREEREVLCQGSQGAATFDKTQNVIKARKPTHAFSIEPNGNIYE